MVHLRKSRLRGLHRSDRGLDNSGGVPYAGLPQVRLRLIPKSEWWHRLPADLMNGIHRPSDSTFPTKPIIEVANGWVLSSGEDDNGVITVEVNEPSQHLLAHALLVISQSGRGNQERLPPYAGMSSRYC